MRETANFSMYSDMSIWIRASSFPNMNSASARASRVFPTPVGPRKMKEPIGRSGSLSPERERRKAREMAEIASSWPITRVWSSPSILRSFSASVSSIRATGISVQRERTLAISSSSTVTFSLLLVSFQVSSSRLSRSWARRSSSRRPAAFSKSWSLTACSFSFWISSRRLLRRSKVERIMYMGIGPFLCWGPVNVLEFVAGVNPPPGRPQSGSTR